MPEETTTTPTTEGGELTESPTYPTETAQPAPTTLSADELAAARDLVIQANPEAVPELIQGSTLSELTASVDQAKAAYQSIAGRFAPSPPAAAETAPPVPTGASDTVDVATLSTDAKIREGLKRRS